MFSGFLFWRVASMAAPNKARFHKKHLDSRSSVTYRLHLVTCSFTRSLNGIPQEARHARRLSHCCSCGYQAQCQAGEGEVGNCGGSKAPIRCWIYYTNRHILSGATDNVPNVLHKARTAQICACFRSKRLAKLAQKEAVARLLVKKNARLHHAERHANIMCANLLLNHENQSEVFEHAYSSSTSP